jgi:hypothetical protein
MYSAVRRQAVAFDIFLKVYVNIITYQQYLDDFLHKKKKPNLITIVVFQPNNTILDYEKKTLPKNKIATISSPTTVSKAKLLKKEKIISRAIAKRSEVERSPEYCHKQ